MNDDLGPNKARLIEVASQANPGEILVDLGVRDGASSFAMLEGTTWSANGGGCRVIGVDPAPRSWSTASFPSRYAYLRLDSVSAAEQFSGPLYMVFFDTLHIKEQVMAELFHYWPKIRVGGWAVFHDTEWPVGKHDVYLEQTWDQAVEGVKAYFGFDVTGPAGAREFFNHEHHPLSWGMTFIQKTAEWTPTVPGMEQALADSKRLTEALCG